MYSLAKDNIYNFNNNSLIKSLNSMNVGTGSFLGGAIGAAGDILGAWMSYEQAKKDRKLKKQMFNKENLLNINQLNMDLDRLRGLNASDSLVNSYIQQNLGFNPNQELNDQQISQLQQFRNDPNHMQNIMQLKQQAKEQVAKYNPSLANLNYNDYKV